MIHFLMFACLFFSLLLFGTFLVENASDEFFQKIANFFHFDIDFLK